MIFVDYPRKGMMNYYGIDGIYIPDKPRAILECRIYVNPKNLFNIAKWCLYCTTIAEVAKTFQTAEHFTHVYLARAMGRILLGT